MCTGWSRILGVQPRSLVAGPCGSSCRDAAQGSQAEPWDAAHIPGLQVLWLRSVSGPSAPCKLPPLPSKRYLCSEEPKFPSCSLLEPSTERQGSAPWPRFLPVLGRSSGARQDPTCPCSRSDPGRQAPLNAGAISMSPHGDTARKDGRAGAGWADSKQVAALEGGQHITTRAQNDPNTRLHPSQGSWLPLAKDSPWRGRENGGDHPQACSEL